MKIIVIKMLYQKKYLYNYFRISTNIIMRKIQMLYIHIDKDYEIDDIIREFQK